MLATARALGCGNGQRPIARESKVTRPYAREAFLVSIKAALQISLVGPKIRHSDFHTVRNTNDDHEFLRSNNLYIPSRPTESRL